MILMGPFQPEIFCDPMSSVPSVGNPVPPVGNSTQTLCNLVPFLGSLVLSLDSAWCP